MDKTTTQEQERDTRRTPKNSTLRAILAFAANYKASKSIACNTPAPSNPNLVN